MSGGAFAVLDASFVLAWGFSEADYEVCREIMRQVAMQGALAPAGYAGEVAEGLLSGVRRKRHSFEDAVRQAGICARLRVTQDSETWDKAWRVVLELAEAQKLSAYDASYLELAKRRGLPLVTFDAKLRAAAKRLHVFVLPQE